MTTQNQNQQHCTFSVGTALGTYYAPWQQTSAIVSLVAGHLGWTGTQADAWIDMDGYDHLSIQGYVTAVGAATATLTVWSDDGSGTWAWDETPGCRDSITNAFAATYVGTGGVNTNFHLHLIDANSRRFQVRLETSDNTGGAVLTFRRTKV